MFLVESFFSTLPCSLFTLPDVRVRYQNRNLHLPFCADEGKHLPGAPEFCTFAAFRDRVKELTPQNWEAECSPDTNTTGH